MSRKRKEEVAKRPNTSNLRPLSPRVKEYFAARGISEATLERNCVRETTQGDIAFLYFRDGEVINIKYRSLDKRFWQASHCTGPLLDVLHPEEVHCQTLGTLPRMLPPCDWCLHEMKRAARESAR